jgi:two-component system sensor histidine kinase UhpB
VLDAPEREVAALTEAFNDMLDRLESERRDSARRALAAQEGEPGGSRGSLHDEIGQLLTGLVLLSETLARRAPDDLCRDLEDLREAARQAAEVVRRIARRLRPEALDELALQSALLALCTAVSDRVGLRIDRNRSATCR